MEYFIKNINDFNDIEINEFYGKIPEIKRKKIDKYKNSDTKVRSIIGELLLSELLSKRNINYSDIDYIYNENSKPYFIDNNLFFNISHSYDYVISVVSDNEIGIDIEKIRETPKNIINQIATQKEKEYILSNEDNIEERIFRIYTLKEAYFKMLGTNLNNILNVEFTINNDMVTCNDKSVNVGFINDIDGYVIAYCEKKKKS